MVATKRLLSGLVSSACAFASAAAIAPIVSLDRCIAVLLSGRPKLTAPDSNVWPRLPWPKASFASSGIRALSSDLARSWSRKAERVAQKRPANSAQEFEF